MQTKSFIIIGVIAALIVGLVVGNVLTYVLYTRKPLPSDTELLARSAAGTELAFAFDRSEPIVAHFETSCEMNMDGLSGDEIDTRADLAIDQVNVLMLELRRSSIPEEWAETYGLYIQALEHYKEYLEKTRDYLSIANSDLEKGKALLRSLSSLLARACGGMELSVNAIILSHLEDVKEVKAFLSKYPNATRWVDRWSDSSGSIVANYIVDNNGAKDKVKGYLDGVWVGDYRAFTLRVFVDNDGKPQEMYVDCHDDKDTPRIYDNIVGYIETETCLMS